MATAKYVMVACLAAGAPVAADDHAPTSLRMREPSPGAREPTSLPLRRVAAGPDPAPAADATPPTAPSNDDSAPPSDDGKTEVIAVTGSTIEHKLFTGRAPVSVVTRADLAASGRGTLGEILQALPAQANAGNAQDNAAGDGTTRVNLRSLGVARTLVLLNGRRLVNGGPGADAAVDLNAIPVAAIERVEVLKDGASAIYGADAVGGVVNLITRPQFDGADVSLLTSTSLRADGAEHDASFVLGFTSSNKHTYLVVSGSQQGHAAVFGNDRPFSRFQDSYDFASKTVRQTTSLALPGGRLDTTSLAPGAVHPPGCASSICTPVGDGTWRDVAPNEGYNEAAQSYLYTPSTRYSLLATGGNRLTDHAGLFLEVMYQHRSSDRELPPVGFVADAPISKDSIYNPLGADILDYRRRMTELGPRQYNETTTVSRLVLGVTGSVPMAPGPLSTWTYELSYNYGVTTAASKTTGQMFRSKLTDALGPSMLDADGVPICVRVPGDPSTKIIYKIKKSPDPEDPSYTAVPCVPLNLLAPAGAIPRGQLREPTFDQSITYDDEGHGSDTTRMFLVTAGGRLAELPHHGSISLSLGGDARYEVGLHSPPSAASPRGGYTTDVGARFTEGRFHLFEGFGEMSIVPLSGHDIAQWVELDLGARALQYNRFGSRVTYKVGGLFRTIHGIAARATYATAFRAPTVFELFGGRTEHLPAAEDPCDTKPPSVGDGSKTLDPDVQARCSAQAVPIGSRFTTSQQFSSVGGNPDLKAETATTTTIGIVVEPPQLKGIALSADYWRIDIASAIEALNAQTILANCYDRGEDEFCNQIIRDPQTHRIFSIDQSLQNVSRTTTSGVDIAVWYDAQLLDLGRIHSGLEAQYLLSYDLETAGQVVHGVGFYDLGVNPRLKANLSSRWMDPSGLSAGFLLRFIGGYRECAGDNCNSARNLASASRDVDRYFKLDLFGGYEIPSRLGKATLQIGINNVLDASPPIVYNAVAANSDSTAYDFLGRMVYVRMSQLF
jgi:outer membrane receptor protein involved in Fe transport